MLSKDLGKISVMAHGAKKYKSKLISTTQVFVLGEYVLFKGKSFYTINEARIIDSFQELLGDLDTLNYGAYLCELTDLAMVEGEVNEFIYESLIKALYLIKNKVGDLELIARTFELYILKASGYALDLDNCSVCSNPIKTSNFFNIHLSGGVCATCKKENGIAISYSAYNLLKFLCKIPLEKVYRINVEKELKDSLSKITSSIILNNYGKIPNSLKSINFMNRSDENV